MLLTILGHNGPYPEPGGACSGYLISSDSGKTHVLLDCGPSVLAQLFRYIPIESLNALVLSHLHYDHMSDALALQYALSASPRGNLAVLAPGEPEAVAQLLLHNRMDVYPPLDQRIGDFAISFLPAVHPVKAYSICVREGDKRLIYTGDTNENAALELFADHADTLLADAGLMEADWKARSPHLSARRCGALAKRVRARQLILTHISPRYTGEDLLIEAKAEYPNAEIAYSGMRVHI